MGSPAATGLPADHSTAWRIVAGVEVAAACITVVLDLFLPTLVLLALAGASLACRRQGLSSLGFARVAHPWRMSASVLVICAGWTVLQLALFMPVVEHATGQRQDMAPFIGLEGNLARLGLLLILTWTLAAVGEETAYRGFVYTRTREVIGTGTTARVIAVLLSAALFGLAHTEQGLVGVLLTFLDGVLFAVLRLHYRTLWASVLAHGFNNTIGLTAFYLVGPIYALW